MRTLAVVGVVAAAVSLLGAASAGARSAIPRPSLELVSLEPLRIRGEGFRPGERVRVTARLDRRTAVAWRRARPGGGFVVAFGPPRGDCAASVRVTAIGRLGSRAGLALDHVTCAPSS